MASQSSSEAYLGRLKPSSGSGQYNQFAFVIQQFLSKVQTATLVKVVSCTNEGGLSAVGFVDVVPMVHQVDGNGEAVPHTTIFNIPYLRIQGGSNGIILDPEVGDIGICVFASRDLSKVKATKAPAVPGSYRMHSFSDGLYLGGVLNGVPSQFVQFSSDGISIVSPTEITLEAPIVTINAGTSATITTPTFTVNGATILNGTLSQTGGGASTFSGDMSTATGNVTAQGVSLKAHVHTGVTTGSGNTGGPQ